jgi:hypothetical protein
MEVPTSNGWPLPILAMSDQQGSSGAGNWKLGTRGVFKQAGFTILNDANNRSFDFGATGQAQTVAAIHAAGLAQTGPRPACRAR